MIPHGLHHRYYAGQLGTYGSMILQPAQFPRGHLGLGQGTYCLDESGNPIPCGTGQVMATLPALPGGGYIPSGQNVQTSPPTATTGTLPIVTTTATTLLQYLPYLAAAGFFLLLATEPRPRSEPEEREIWRATPRRRRR